KSPRNESGRSFPVEMPQRGFACVELMVEQIPISHCRFRFGELALSATVHQSRCENTTGCNAEDQGRRVWIEGLGCFAQQEVAGSSAGGVKPPIHIKSAGHLFIACAYLSETRARPFVIPVDW